MLKVKLRDAGSTSNIRLQAGPPAQMMFWFGSGRVAHAIYSGPGRVGPNCPWVGSGKILKLRPVQTLGRWASKLVWKLEARGKMLCLCRE
jgi:hypothetical protein